MRPDPPRARDGPGLIMTQRCWARHDQLTNARAPAANNSNIHGDMPFGEPFD